jgi:hypothetical protein
MIFFKVYLPAIALWFCPVFPCQGKINRCFLYSVLQNVSRDNWGYNHLIPLFSQKGIKLIGTCNTCLQDQQSVFTDLHTLNSPWWGVHISESQCRRHSWLGCLLFGGTQETIKVCDCFARLQSPRFVFCQFTVVISWNCAFCYIFTLHVAVVICTY